MMKETILIATAVNIHGATGVQLKTNLRLFQFPAWIGYYSESYKSYM